MTLEKLKAETRKTEKTEWRPMLEYVAELHEKSTHPPREPFPYPWEEIGPGYCYGPAFGHWDIVHQILDVLPSEPQHARHQILNNLVAQQEDGLVPGTIWMRDEKPKWNNKAGHPPVWPFAVEDYVDNHSLSDIIADCHIPLLRQIGWFEEHRAAEPRGFFYTDILDHTWESGVDEGIRFLDVQTGPFACVDATAHVYALYDFAARWSARLGKDSEPFAVKADAILDFIQNELYVEEVGFFFDLWAVRDSAKRHIGFEGMWPVVVGAANPEQAKKVIHEHLLNPDRFFTAHPIATVGAKDPHFELRLWRGPAWNSMTYWAARGCLRYGENEAARVIVERALDRSAEQFERTGTVWEFYHPLGGRPEDLERKPHTKFNTPCREYLGHNPLIAMARMYDEV